MTRGYTGELFSPGVGWVGVLGTNGIPAFCVLGKYECVNAHV